MHDLTRDPPYPDTCRTGRLFFTPCCTASTHEFMVDGVLHLAFHVAGHKWFHPRPGRVEDINNDGILVEVDGTVRCVRWRVDRGGASTPDTLASDSAADWRQEARELRAMADAPHISRFLVLLLRRWARASDFQAEWWDAGGGEWPPKTRDGGAGTMTILVHRLT